MSESFSLNGLLQRPCGTTIDESGKNHISGAAIVPSCWKCKAPSLKPLRRSLKTGFPSAFQTSPIISVASVPLNSKGKYLSLRRKVSDPSPFSAFSCSIQSAEINRSVPFAGSNRMASICRRAFLWPSFSPWISPPFAVPVFDFSSHENSVTWKTRLSFATR